MWKQSMCSIRTTDVEPELTLSFCLCFDRPEMNITVEQRDSYVATIVP